MAAFNGTENEKVFISQELFDELSLRSGAPEQGDVMVTGGGSVGTPYIVPDNSPLYTKDADLIWIKHNEKINPYYLFSYFTSPAIKAYIAGISHVGTIAHYTIEQVKATPVPFPPCVGEQRLLGAFFRDINSLITLHQRKYDKLVQMKKALLDKMFPKTGECVPKIRFKGFTDPWEQRKLGDCGTTFSGLSGKNRDDFGHGEARFVPYTNVFDNPIADSERLEAVEIDDSQTCVRYGDVFFTTSSETPDEVGMSSVWLSDQRDVYLNSFCFGYRQDGSLNNFYLAHILRSPAFRNQIKLLAQGISRFNISKRKVMDLVIWTPRTSEQRLIGALFRDIDDLIALHQRKLELLKNIKKSLLEGMFI